MSKKELVEKKNNNKDLAMLNSYQQLKTIATDLFDSGLFTHLKNPQQAIAVVEYGRELGVPPMQALQTMAVINGRIGMESKLLLGLAKRAGYEMDIIKSTNKECEINFITPKGKEHKVTFSMDEAIQLGSATKYSGEIKDAYKKQPANMLLQRAISKAVRRFAPEALLDDGKGMGMYSIEELSDGNVTTVEEVQNIEILPEFITIKKNNKDIDLTLSEYFTAEEMYELKDDDNLREELKHRDNFNYHYSPKSPLIFSQLSKMKAKVSDEEWAKWKEEAKKQDFKKAKDDKQLRIIAEFAFEMEDPKKILEPASKKGEG